MVSTARPSSCAAAGAIALARSDAEVDIDLDGLRADAVDRIGKLKFPAAEGTTRANLPLIFSA